MNSKNTSLYKEHGTVYTDPVSGKFNIIRLTSMSFMILSFFILPWFFWGDNQAFLFDIATARLYVCGLVFWPEDFSLFAIFFIILVLLLFAATVYAGRIWCGFLCPQSIWLKVGAFLSRIIEGKRNTRKKLDEGKFTFNFFLKKLCKHVLWFSFSFFTAFTFVGYFVPISFLFDRLYFFDFSSWSYFWILFFSLLTYFNIGWFREQFCFLVCPYARLQSVMFDENTLIVVYDRNRGEKRGSRKRGIEYKNFGLGDCIDCKKCVTCCPTGIDIRNGLQMECISCAACIDACNSVMNRMGYKSGLIRYMRENELINKVKNFGKVRLISYIVVLFLLFSLFNYGLFDRKLIQFSVSKSQLQLFNIDKNNLVENTYVLKITNKTKIKNSYNILVDDSRFKYIGIDKIILDGEDTILIDIKLLLTNVSYKSRFIEVFFKIQSSDDSKNYIIKKSQFVMPGL